MLRCASSAAWYRAETAAHDKALAAPQRFPLTGDGIRTRRLVEAIVEYGADIAPLPSRNKLATARYRDWRAQREQ